MLKKIVVTLLSLVLVLLVLVRFTAIPAPFDSASTSYQLLLPGDYAVTMEELKLVDEFRSVPDTRVEGQTLPRTIDLRIWYPDTAPARAMPLVLYSHGMMGNFDEGLHYANHFVSHGYIFVAPNFPLTNMSNGQEANAVDVVNQPADISFILDEILRRNSDKQDVLYGRIDTDQLVAMGLSLGGMTTHMLGYDPQRMDTRFNSLVAIAAPSVMFTGKFFASREVPYLAVASPKDSFIEYTSNALAVLEKIKPATLVTIADGSHTGYAYQSRWLRWLSNPDSLGCSVVKKNLDASLEDEDDWYPLLGSIEDGYIFKSEVAVCEAELEPAMNPIRQNELTLLAVWSFLQCQFAAQPLPYCEFLAEGLAAENAQVTYAKNY